MQAFMDNARVQVSNNGLYFYEKDIVMSKYKFSRDVKIDMVLGYQHSGFGVLISEDEDGGPMNSNHKYLFHLGTNQFSCFEKHLTQRTESSIRTNAVAPALDSEIKLRFHMRNKRVRMYLITQVGDTEHETELGSHTILRKFTNYYIGFYSAAGNTLRDVTFMQGVPDRWHVSIANVHGGRISFWEDGFMFEDCIHDAELEQKEVSLSPGKYWFQYDTEEVNGKFDIQGFIYQSRVPAPYRDAELDAKYSDAMPHTDDDGKVHLRRRERFDETYLEDEGKDIILNDKGMFEISYETKVVVSFKGMNGKVSHVCIKDEEKGEFVATEDTAIKTDGSWITVSLNGIIGLKWEGIIYDVPAYEDLTKKPPYGVIATDNTRVVLDSLLINLGEQYSYYFDVPTLTLESHRTVDGNYQATKTVSLAPSDNNKIKLFMNVKAQMTNLILIMEDGTEINVNIQKTYKKFVPGYIVGPIIVTDENNSSFELSASYREVVRDDAFAISLFSKSALELKLPYHTSTMWYPLQVYGIPKGATIDTSQDTIEKFASDYTLVNDAYVKFSNDIVRIPAEIRDDYEYIAVRYQRADLFQYIFTTYEREVFDGHENMLSLENTLNESGQGVIVYGIPENGGYNPEYLLRVPNRDMGNAIDLCAVLYDMISPTLYEINTTESMIKMSSDLNDKYAYYIVDYMKKNSYSVNWVEEYKQYEVDISSDEPVMRIHYEMDENGNSSRKIRTVIKPNQNKFIILRRQKGLFLDED